MLGGIGFAFQYFLFNVGLQYTSSGIAFLMVKTEIIGLIILSCLILKEKINSLKILGILITFIGIFLACIDFKGLHNLFSADHIRMKGNFIIFCAGFCWSFFGISRKILIKKRGIFACLIPIFFISTITSALLVFFDFKFIPPLKIELIFELFFVGIVCTGLAYLLLAKGFQKLPASTTGIITCMLPIFSMIEASLIFKEIICLNIWIYGIMCISGILLVLYVDKKNTKILKKLEE
ncbi:MAG: DMT family transporter [bacterium]